MTVSVPHFAFPLTFSGSTFAKVDQDSDDDLNQSVAVLILTPIGTREELPQYGVPDMLSAQQPISTAPIVAALSRWEPRASVLLSSTPDALDQKIADLLAQVGRAQ